MTNKEAVNWLINLTADIGKPKHHDLWHYEQALYEIKEMLERAVAQPERKKGVWLEDEDDPESIKTDGYCGYCSACKEMSEYLTSYCGSCGADMRGTWNEKCR